MKEKTKIDTLRKRKDFKKIYKEGKHIRGKYLDIYMLFKAEDNCKIRLGFDISKKIGNAVKRNRIRRILKEIFIKIDKEYNISVDIIFVAKKGIYNISFWDLKDHIGKIFTPSLKQAELKIF